MGQENEQDEPNRIPYLFHGRHSEAHHYGWRVCISYISAYLPANVIFRKQTEIITNSLEQGSRWSSDNIDDIDYTLVLPANLRTQQPNADLDEGDELDLHRGMEGWQTSTDSVWQTGGPAAAFGYHGMGLAEWQPDGEPIAGPSNLSRQAGGLDEPNAQDWIATGGSTVVNFDGTDLYWNNISTAGDPPHSPGSPHQQNNLSMMDNWYP